MDEIREFFSQSGRKDLGDPPLGQQALLWFSTPKCSGPGSDRGPLRCFWMLGPEYGAFWERPRCQLWWAPCLVAFANSHGINASAMATFKRPRRSHPRGLGRGAQNRLSVSRPSHPLHSGSIWSRNVGFPGCFCCLWKQ